MVTLQKRLATVAGLVAFIWTFLLVGGLALGVYNINERNKNAQVEGRLKAIALSAASFIDGDIHRRLTEQGNEEDPDFQHLVSQLKRVQASNSVKDDKIAYLYTFWRDPDDPSRVRFGLDTGEGGDHSSLNSLYEDPATEAAIAAFETGKAQCDPITEDSYGIFKTAYAPVFDSTGTVVALVGVDLEAAWPPAISASMIMLFIVVILLATVLAVAMGHALSPAISRPLEKLAAVAGKVAQGDLTVQLPQIKVHREFSGLAESFATMLDNLRRLAGQISQGTEKMYHWSSALEASAGQAGEGANEVARMMSEVASGADSVAASTTRIADELVRIDGLAGDMAHKASIASAIATGTREQADRGALAVNDAVLRAQEAARTLNSTAMQVAAFKQWSGEIAETAGFISTLAEQIHMLSMNAQIEAARAGDAGRGFSVVAEKIAGLSDETAEFVGRIGIVNREIGTRIEQVGSSIIDTDRQVNESTGLLEDVRRTFGEIADGIRQVAAALTEISTAARALKAGTLASRSETDVIAGITVETAASIEQVSAGTEEQAALSEEVNSAVKRLHELADLLAAETRTFKL